MSAWPEFKTARIPKSWVSQGLRELAHVDAEDLPARFQQYQRMLGQSGLSLNDLADQIDRSGISGNDQLLEPDSSFTLDTLTTLYRQHGKRVEFLPFLPWYSECVSRLRRAQPPTAMDWQQRGDLQGRLRIGKSTTP
jgi:hypothetical protein